MHELGIGKLITMVEQRDAIHIAVAPVTAIDVLSPGQPIKFAIVGNMDMVKGCHLNDAVGIVDPYLPRRVKGGESFWMFLKPNTITSLRHEWTHPVFAGETKTISEWWLRDFAEKLDVTYEELMAGGRAHALYSGSDLPYDILDDAGIRAFWKHYEIATGEKVADHDEQIFRCAC